MKGTCLSWGLLLVVFIGGLTGCTAQRVASYKVPNHNFTAPIGEKLTVETGSTMFIEGEYIQGEQINIDEPIDLMIPGSMLIPFPVHIGATGLQLTSITPEWKYYCGEQEEVAASFPGLGSVIRSGDCVGVRVSTDGIKKQWVVDNSNYNDGWGATIWSLSFSSEDMLNYVVTSSNIPFRVKALKRMTFDGYYGKQLHFTWEEINGHNARTRDFTFDFNGEPTVVGIRGNQFVVHRADNVGLDYEWRKFM